MSAASEDGVTPSAGSDTTATYSPDGDSSGSAAAGAAASNREGRAAARARRKLERALREEPTSFGFFQAVRLLTRLRPDRARIGGWADPKDEVIRFGVQPTLGFPPSELHSLDLPDEGEARAARMNVHFIGLTGAQGVLPLAYTEHVMVRTRARDTAFRDFLDLFHHRIISLFYRAWERARFALAAEDRHEDRLHDHLRDLAGMGTAALRNRLPVPDASLAFYAGLLAGRTRPADGLSRLIGDYFGVHAEVVQFIGAWRRLDQGGQCTLGEDAAAGRLGWSVIGDEAWDPQARVRLRLGPLTRREYDAFQPGGDAYAALASLCRLYADDQVEVEAQLVLARDEVPPVMLGARLGVALGAPPTGAPGAAAGAANGAGNGAAPPTLGRGTWLAARPMTRDPDETVLTLC